MSLDSRILDNLRRRLADLRENISAFDVANWDDIEEKRRKADSLAATLCVLVNQTKGNKSLLGSAGLYDELRVPDTTKVDIVPGKKDTQFDGLVISSIRTNDTSEPLLSLLVGLLPLRAPSRYRGIYVPRIEAIAKAPTVGLADWWGGRIGAANELITRGSLCRIVRSKDGIGHVDPVLEDQEYLKLAGYKIGNVWVEEVGHDTAVYTKSENGDVSSILIVDEVPNTGAPSPSSTSGPKPVVNGVSAIVRQIAGELELSLRNIGV